MNILVFLGPILVITLAFILFMAGVVSRRMNKPLKSFNIGDQHIDKDGNPITSRMEE